MVLLVCTKTSPFGEVFCALGIKKKCVQIPLPNPHHHNSSDTHRHTCIWHLLKAEYAKTVTCCLYQVVVCHCTPGIKIMYILLVVTEE